ncbi:hypothetical protein [Spiroplasma phoeniceum]|nr:hypothetical protein [Spiroplasma phoeniceum]
MYNKYFTWDNGFLGDAWIILIPFAVFLIIKVLNFFRVMVKGF